MFDKTKKTDRLTWSLFILSVAACCLTNQTITAKEFSLSDKKLLKEWGFTDEDFSGSQRFMNMVDTIRDPINSSKLQANIIYHRRIAMGPLTPENYFTILSNIHMNSVRAPYDNHFTIPELLLLIPQLIAQGYNPNFPIVSNYGLWGYNNFTKVPDFQTLLAPVIFLAITIAGNKDPRVLASLLQHPEVDVNVREAKEQQFSNPLAHGDKDLILGDRSPQTPLHFIIRTIVACKEAACRNGWIDTLKLLLQRPDVDLNAEITLRGFGVAEHTETPFTLAHNDPEILAILIHAQRIQDERLQQMTGKLVAQQITPESALQLSPLAVASPGPIAAVASTSSGGAVPIGAQPFSLKPHAPKDIKGASGKPDRYPIKLPDGLTIPRPDLSLSIGNWIPSYFNKNNLIIATLCGIIYTLWNTPKKVEDAYSVEQSKNVTCIIDTENNKDLNISSVQEERE